MAVEVPIRLTSLEEHIIAEHGEERSLTPSEEDLLVDLAVIIRREIQRQWPVDTGFSRDRWSVEVRTDFGRMGFVIRNDAFYVEYIHRAGDITKDPLWDDVIRSVFAESVVPSVDELKREVNATEGLYRVLLARRLGEGLSIERAKQEATLDLYRGRAPLNAGVRAA